MYRDYRSTMMRVGPGMTPAVKYLIISNVAVYLLQFLTRGTMDVLFSVTENCFREFWLWQPFTYMFLHSRANPMHLVFNMFILWMLGCDLERLWGSLRFLKYYLVCGVGAGFLIAVTSYFGGGWTLGASGAIFGLMVAFAVLFPNAVILAFFLFPIRARNFVLILVAIELFMLMAYGQYSNVSHLGHLGGALVGFVYLKWGYFANRVIDSIRWKLRRRKYKLFDDKDDDHREFPYYH